MNKSAAHEKAIKRAECLGYTVLICNDDCYQLLARRPEEIPDLLEWQTVAEYYGTDNGVEIVPNNEFKAGV